METKVVATVIAIVIALGGGYWYITSQSAEPYVPPAPTTSQETTTQEATPTAYALSEISLHPDRSSCWSAINGNVYDLTSWIDRHPGGAERILSICGKDGSSAFSKKHLGEPKPEKMLASFKIGVLAP